jgi:CHAT domain-containing protein
VFPRPASLEELQEAIPPDGVLVLYQLASEEALALVVTAEGASLHALGRTADVTSEAQEFLEAASWEGSDEEPLARRLHDRLLAPLERPLAGRRRLIVSPDGILAFLPFEALARADGSRVLDAWEVGYVPSGTVLAGLRSQAARGGKGAGVLAVGDPSPATGRLPAAGDEVRAIGALFEPGARTLLLGEDASLGRLEEELGRDGRRRFALHLACHGRLDAEHPRQTGLVLARGEVLSLDELHRLRVPADLAVLSACETGRGRLLRGEGVLGLVRGFFAAGAPRVVASNWRVDDEATRRLMVAFYRKMLSEGLGAAAALRAAKQELRRAGGPSAHPSRWAPFVFWGVPD